MRICIRFTMIVFLALLGTTMGEEKPHNGYWWARFSESDKVVFVSGYGEAMTHAHNIAFSRCMADKSGGRLPEEYPGDEVLKACMKSPAVAVFDFSHMLVGQLADGVDEFYKDFRNKLIDINLAMRYTRDQLKGKSAKELEDDLTLWRRGPVPAKP